MYRYINSLSIDISLGAVIVSYFFSLVFDVPADGFSLLVLGLSVWIIYAVDHLLDAKRINAKTVTFRHQFFKRNFETLKRIVVFVIFITAGFTFYYLNKSTIIYGFGIGGIAFLYLIFQRQLAFGKELVGSILYTLGVLVPVVGQSDIVFTSDRFLIVIQFFLVVLLNLVLFSHFDERSDKVQQQQSIATQFSTTAINRIFWALFFFTITIGVLNVYLFPTGIIAVGIILMMATILGFIQYKRNLFAIHDRFRYVGDAIFFLPLIYLFLV